MPQKSRFLSCVLLIAALLLANSAQGKDATYPDVKADKFMKEWVVLGPIVLHGGEEDPDETKLRATGFQADLLEAAGGEANLVPKPDDTVKILDRNYQWKLIKAADDAVDLSEHLSGSSWSIAYAAVTVNAPQDTKGMLGIGSDDAVRVWLNGDLIHDNWATRRVTTDADLAAVQLRRGRNRLLVKIYNSKQDWGFACRFLSPQEQAKQLVRAAASRDAEKMRNLLAAGVDINSTNEYGITAYRAAKIRGNEAIATELESQGAATDDAFDPQELVQSFVRSNASEENPGIAVLVSKDGEILFRGGFGLASIEHGVAVTAETKFRIGSVTKQFTAAAILKLQEEGKLSTTDTLNKYIPDYPRGDEVTIHHLLSHSSGIADFTSKRNFFSTVASSVTADELIESFKHDEFKFGPGEKFAYCNSGYFLLGYIIEKVSGASYGDYLKRAFFQPLEMHDTGVHEATAVLKHEATGYSYADSSITKALDWDMSRAGAAGNLYSTVVDLHRWNEGIFNGKVLSEESLQAAHTVVQVKQESSMSFPYGYGWIIDEHRGLKRISHSGGLNGFVSQLTHYPQHDLTVVALHNAFPQVPQLVPSRVCDFMAEAFLWEHMKSQPKYEVAHGVDPEKFTDYVGRYDYRGAVLTVTKEGDKLMAQLPGQAKYEIFPAGEDKFFWKVVDAQVEFLRDSSGKVTSARHAQGIVKFIAPRVEEQTEIKVDKETLDHYVGKYDYQGLGVLTVRREDGQLLAQMTGQPEFKIFAKTKTKFFWKVIHAEIEFVTDEDGKVNNVIFQQAGRKLEAKKIP